MVLRRPSVRSREGLNDGHRRTSAGEQSRTPGRCARGQGFYGLRVKPDEASPLSWETRK